MQGSSLNVGSHDRYGNFQWYIYLLWLKPSLKFIVQSPSKAFSPFVMAKAMKKAVEEAPPMKKGMRRAMKAMKAVGVNAKAMKAMKAMK